MWVCAILKFATAPLSEMNFFYAFAFFDRPGYDFKAIKLKISQLVGLIILYILCKFLINSLQIRVRTSLLCGKNSSAFLLRFTILKFATGSSEWDDITEIVPYLSAILECGLAFMCAIWTHKTKRKTGNMVDKYFSGISYHSEGQLRISTLRKFPFFSDFNIVWLKPYHSTRVRLPVLCKLWTNPLKNLKFYARLG